MNRVYDWPGLAEAGVAVMQRQIQMPQRMEADDSLLLTRALAAVMNSVIFGSGIILSTAKVATDGCGNHLAYGFQFGLGFTAGAGGRLPNEPAEHGRQ